ncbi:MAG: IPT/TIG domain-containing protein [Acidobacteriia bacterium]|nr:IPT/TIG domain-containing protein [Terriglobia bacterium]
MTKTPANDLDHNEFLPLPGTKEGRRRYRNKVARRRLTFLAAVLLAPLIFAQGSPQVTGVEPSSGKVNDTVTVTGQNLGKDSVSSVFLSDDKNDYKAAIVEQKAEQIVVKVPQVKPGEYNVSIQVGDKIYIKPLRFTVQE